MWAVLVLRHCQHSVLSSKSTWSNLFIKLLLIGKLGATRPTSTVNLLAWLSRWRCNLSSVWSRLRHFMVVSSLSLYLSLSLAIVNIRTTFLWLSEASTWRLYNNNFLQTFIYSKLKLTVCSNLLMEFASFRFQLRYLESTKVTSSTFSGGDLGTIVRHVRWRVPRGKFPTLLRRLKPFYCPNPLCVLHVFLVIEGSDPPSIILYWESQ